MRVPTVARDVYDVSGAGDTVTAVMAVALAVGATPVRSSGLGQPCRCGGGGEGRCGHGLPGGNSYNNKKLSQKRKRDESS